MLYVATWYVSIRPVVMRVKEKLLCSSSFTLAWNITRTSNTERTAV